MKGDRKMKITWKRLDYMNDNLSMAIMRVDRSIRECRDSTVVPELIHAVMELKRCKEALQETMKEEPSPV